MQNVDFAINAKVEYKDKKNYFYNKKPAKLEMSSSMLPITLPFFLHDVIEIQYKVCSIECRGWEDDNKMYIQNSKIID